MARRDVLCEGKWLRLKKRGRWEFVERVNASSVVAMVAVTREGEIILVEQYRPAVKKKVIELPAGLVGDVGDDHSQTRTAKREMLEETGFRVHRVEFLVELAASAGLTSETTCLYRCTGLRRVGEGGGDETESIKVHRRNSDGIANLGSDPPVWYLSLTRQGDRMGIRTAVLLALALAACTAPTRNPPPPELGLQGTIPGMGVVRWWGDEKIPEYDQWMGLPDDKLKAKYPALVETEHHYLAVSGGGANGAYGAGILCGLTEAGNRPEYAIVTGISTGALTAPFAFLGPKYDHVLKQVYTTLSTKDLVKKRGLMAVLRNDSVADTTGLREMIAKYITQEVVDEIAAEQRKGRGLFVATTNLDAGRS
ncbi:MAG: patatin-like phospholipase family protein, partial [Planctomycetota bacterium]